MDNFPFFPYENYKICWWTVETHNVCCICPIILHIWIWEWERCATFPFFTFSSFVHRVRCFRICWRSEQFFTFPLDLFHTIAYSSLARHYFEGFTALHNLDLFAQFHLIFKEGWVGECMICVLAMLFARNPCFISLHCAFLFHFTVQRATQSKKNKAYWFVVPREREFSDLCLYPLKTMLTNRIMPCAKFYLRYFW